IPATAPIMQAYVKDIMTAPVVTVSAGTPYQDMAVLLRAHKVSGFPVVDDERKVIGVVSESDLLDGQAAAATATASDLMTSPPVAVGPDEKLRYAAYLMHSRKLR